MLISNGFFGAERVVYNLLNSFLLEKKALDLHLIVNQEIVNNFSDLITKGIKIHNLGKCVVNNFYFGRFGAKEPTKKLSILLNQQKFDLINSHMLTLPQFYQEIFKAKISHVMTFHGNEIKNYLESKDFFYQVLVRPYFSRVLTKSNFVISVAQHLIKDLPERIKTKTKIIANGVDFDLFKPQTNIFQKENTILYVGRFIERKGVRELINVSKQLPQFNFLFAGKGPLENLIVGKNVQNLGLKSTKDLIDLYNQTTISVFPSYWEGCCLSCLEAMACQKPVIASTLGFDYVLHRQNGLVVQAKNEKELKKSIIMLMTDLVLRGKLAINARKTAVQSSWNNVAQQYLQVFQQAILEN